MAATYEPRHGDRVRIEGHGVNYRGETRSFIYEGVIDRPYPDLPGWRLRGTNLLTGADCDKWFSSDEQMNDGQPGYAQTTRPIPTEGMAS
ncbi:hypothetical protein [Streptomyces sp. NPDC015125]|uniref:hypothetical protein n=1 Tax=Streptomyces sp. NPDC015125 TaxID=3364938 RepID=UPI0036F7ED0C